MPRVTAKPWSTGAILIGPLRNACPACCDSGEDRGGGEQEPYDHHGNGPFPRWEFPTRSEVESAVDDTSCERYCTYGEHHYEQGFHGTTRPVVEQIFICDGPG